MMRALLAALLAANLGFWGWTQGWFDALVGASPHGQREPQRLLTQLHPERLRIVRAAPAAAAPAAPVSPADSAATEPGCFEAGPFSPAEVVAAEAALVRAALPPGSWHDLRIDRPGAWIVYLGRFASREQKTEREDELRRQGVAPTPLRDAPDLEPGLSLGRFEDRASADAALARLVAQGVVRNARVVAISAPSSTHLLRIEHADAALQAQLTALRAPALGAGFMRCGQRALAMPAR